MPIKTPKRIPPADSVAVKHGRRNGRAVKRKLPNVAWKDMKAVYDILGHRYDSGDPTISARHNEHQP